MGAVACGAAAALQAHTSILSAARDAFAAALAAVSSRLPCFSARGSKAPAKPLGARARTAAAAIAKQLLLLVASVVVAPFAAAYAAASRAFGPLEELEEARSVSNCPD